MKIRLNGEERELWSPRNKGKAVVAAMLLPAVAILLGGVAHQAIENKSGARGLSLIVEDTNLKARKLYERLGFNEVARQPFHPFPGSYPVENWILMERELQRPES